MSEVKIVKTACQASHCECGVLVHVKDDKVIKIKGDPEHPMNRGKLCPKGLAYTQLLYHPHRLKYPLKRMGKRGGANWQRISWDEALDTIVSRFTKIKEKDGPLSLATSCGTQPRGTFTSTKRLAYALGTPNAALPGHICFIPSIIAELATYGTFITAEVGPDYQNANCILVWGANPLVAHPPRGRDILDAKKRGAKLIVIDPRQTKLAAKADFWLQIRPGTDAALALGMMHIIVNERLYDKEFVNKWCVGFEKLAERLQEYSPDRISKITWIPEVEIRRATIAYATTKPATFHHRAALEQNLNASQTCRAMALLVALTGNIDIKGGNVFPSYPPGFMTRADLLTETPIARELAEKCIGARTLPLYSGPDSPLQNAHTPLLIKAMLTGKPYPIKALYATTSNILINSENTKYVWEALHQLEFMVVADFFMTPT
ncbi:molybdopterin-dependent oxidoreductase, partial [Chloroflexota bacterium]